MSSASLLTTPPLKSPLRRCHVTPITMSLNLNLNPQNPNPKTIITTITRLLWGQSLPPQLLISAVRSSWNATWHLMMSQLAPSDPSGNYSRPTSQFSRQTQQFSRQKSTILRLYVGLSCPWAHRTLIVRILKGLEGSVPVSIASPGIDGSWEFPNGDVGNGSKTLRGVYEMRKGVITVVNWNENIIKSLIGMKFVAQKIEPYKKYSITSSLGYSGRATVPMLWDISRKDVVCNESYDIIELFNSGLNELATNPELDLSPPSLKGEIEKWNQIIYPNVNNGVYRCGFAQSQQAYDSAVNELFTTLDMLDKHLEKSRYLCGDVLTLADICLFTTLIRFDLVYNVLFKCTKRKLIEYQNLHAYIRDIYQIPKVASTCDFEAIMDGYYKILFPLNPGAIRPVMPLKCDHNSLFEPHNRESLSLVDEVMCIPVA